MPAQGTALGIGLGVENITPATKKVILTRSVSEGPGVYPSLTLRVSMRSMRNFLAGVRATP